MVSIIITANINLKTMGRPPIIRPQKRIDVVCRRPVSSTVVFVFNMLKYVARAVGSWVNNFKNGHMVNLDEFILLPLLLS